MNRGCHPGSWAFLAGLMLPSLTGHQVSFLYQLLLAISMPLTQPGPIPLLLGRYPPIARSGGELWPALQEEEAESLAGGIWANMR